MEALIRELADANRSVARIWPGERTDRQPVHTVYGGAHLFKRDTARRLGGLALASLQTYAPDAQSFAKVFGFADQLELSDLVYNRVVQKLETEPVEDFRIDFEDGYGNRADEEEDEHARAVVSELLAGAADGTLSPFIGIRIKPLTDELARRSLRTLDLVVDGLLSAGDNPVENFVVTLPKVTHVQHVKALCSALAIVEDRHGIKRGTVPIEIMVETPQTIFDAEGGVHIPALIDAAQGRCIAAHFGTYDYTASCNITAAHQHMMHPACDFARHVMQVSLAGRGIMISDGATNILPAPPHKGDALTDEQRSENADTVHRAWRLAWKHTQHSLECGFYQGWDLHPAQLPVRYGAVYAFFLGGLDAATDRLSAFVDKLGRATLMGDVFDDAATGQGLLNYFLRALSCGAITEQEALETGLTLDEIRGRSFAAIVKNRMKGEVVS